MTRNGSPARRPPREAERHRRLLRAARRGDAGARERLVAAHLDLVRQIAAHYRGLGLPHEDLVQEGSIGLLEAIDRFDPRRQPDFEAFARFRVRRSIRNALTEQARFVRLPKQIVERRRLLAKTAAQLAACGADATPEALAAATGLPEEAVRTAQAIAGTPLSLDEARLDGGARLGELVADKAAPDPEEETLSHEEAELLRDAVRHLAPRQREIVCRRFGLGRDETPIAALADGIHLSERRTRSLEQDALFRLARELRSQR
jgi:RNA polymerase primary sigma factor